jgi:hypothetical protein
VTQNAPAPPNGSRAETTAGIVRPIFGDPRILFGGHQATVSRAAPTPKPDDLPAARAASNARRHRPYAGEALLRQVEFHSNRAIAGASPQRQSARPILTTNLKAVNRRKRDRRVAPPFTRLKGQETEPSAGMASSGRFSRKTALRPSCPSSLWRVFEPKHCNKTYRNAARRTVCEDRLAGGGNANRRKIVAGVCRRTESSVQVEPG